MNKEDVMRERAKQKRTHKEQKSVMDDLNRLTKPASKYDRLQDDLMKTGTGEMKCFGNSMLPILSNPSTNTYRKQDIYKKGDIVFCKVRGRFIDAHLITKVAADGQYMISNNHGHDNGWTKTIYGRVVKSVDNSGNEKYFS